MTVQIRVTAMLQQTLGGEKRVEVEGGTVREVLGELERRYPGFKRQVTGEDGQLHRFVNVYLNDEDIRYLQHLETPLKANDVIVILPALAGGSAS